MDERHVLKGLIVSLFGQLEVLTRYTTFDTLPIIFSTVKFCLIAAKICKFVNNMQR